MNALLQSIRSGSRRSRPGRDRTAWRLGIECEQAISASDSLASQDSRACTWRLIGLETHPGCRPASVAWMVETIGHRRIRPGRYPGGPPASRGRARRAPIAEVRGRPGSSRVPSPMSRPSCRGRTRTRAGPGRRLPARLGLVGGGVAGGIGAGRAAAEHHHLVSIGGQRGGQVVHVTRPLDTGGYSHDTIRIFTGAGSSPGQPAISAPNRPSAAFQPAASRSTASRRPEDSASAILAGRVRVQVRR